jgi:hypothetical protein
MSKLAMYAYAFCVYLTSVHVGMSAERDDGVSEQVQRTITFIVQNEMNVDMTNVTAEYSRFYDSHPPLVQDVPTVPAGQEEGAGPITMPNSDPCVRVSLKFTVNNEHFTTAWYSILNNRHIKQVIFIINGVHPTNFVGRLSEENVAKSDAGAASERLFEGTSKHGDVSDAILKAANNALDANPNFVRWELVALRGERGGIAGAKDVTAVIGVRGEVEEQGFSDGRISRHTSYIKLVNETDDLDQVVINLSNWRHSERFSVERKQPQTLVNLPAVGFGVAAFDATSDRRRAIGGDAFQLGVPFEVSISGKAGRYKLAIKPLE